jgi:putative hydrolase of the HAD superfamily
MKLPRAILFDLDDTILVAFGPARSQWQRTIAAFADRLGPIEATIIAAVIEAATTELWADPARHKYWRHRTGAARRRIVATAFAALAATGHPVPPRRSVTHWPTPITPCAALRPGSRRLALPVGGLTCQRDV